jgi:hypothetical protein
MKPSTYPVQQLNRVRLRRMCFDSTSMQALARQKYWEISLSVEPKISTLNNSKTFEDYKMARQVKSFICSYL